MRAYRLGLVATSSSSSSRLGGGGGGYCKQLLVEPLERRFAAALLADATCLLLPLSSSSSSNEGGILLRSPPCSDAAFLRLQGKKDPVLQFGQLSDGGGNRTLLLLASSSKGGSCTDIRAWACDEEEQQQVPVVGVPRGKSGATAMVARLAIPHGATVKMAASVNVLVVYSPSVSKLWVLAAKALESRLLLITCAVLDCAQTVQAMFLSPQHLVLGEKGGVRVLPLRPLVKGRNVHPEEQPPVNGMVQKTKKRNGFMECSSASLGDGDVDLIAIAPISARAFLVLDSSGELRSVTMRVPPSRSPKAAWKLQLDVKPVLVSFPVSAFAVLPQSTTPGPRRLWASDGNNSVHILCFSEDHQGGCIKPAVVQAMFMATQVASMVALSPQTVLVLTQGTVVAYVAQVR